MLRLAPPPRVRRGRRGRRWRRRRRPSSGCRSGGLALREHLSSAWHSTEQRRPVLGIGVTECVVGRVVHSRTRSPAREVRFFFRVSARAGAPDCTERTPYRPLPGPSTPQAPVRPPGERRRSPRRRDQVLDTPGIHKSKASPTQEQGVLLPTPTMATTPQRSIKGRVRSSPGLPCV